jgi:hypothetical protein
MARISNATAGASLSGNLREASSVAKSHSTLDSVHRASTLQELENQLTDVAARFQALVQSSGEELCNAAPVPGSWSAAQCLHHLNISSDAYFPVWQQVISAAGSRKVELSAPYKVDFWGRLLSWILEPPARIRSRTPLHLEPAESVDCSHTLEGFLDRQQRIVATLHRCRGRAIDQVRMASPADPRIRYSIWSSFVIVAAHQRRHLWQAEQAIATLRTQN